MTELVVYGRMNERGDARVVVDGRTVASIWQRNFRARAYSEGTRYMLYEKDNVRGTYFHIDRIRKENHEQR